MKKWILIAAVLGAAVAGRADVLQTLSNARTGMVVDAERSDWAGAVPYVDDWTLEPGIGPFDVDWLRVTLAHAPDASLLYVRYETVHGADFGLYPAFYNIYIDTDLTRASGYIGGVSQLPIGADYLIQGASVFQFTGAGQTDFSWSYVGAGSYDNSHTNYDLELSFAPSMLGGATTFHFVVIADNALNGNTQDYYPDTAGSGVGGDYFAYAFAVMATSPVFVAGSIGAIPALSFESQQDIRYQLHYRTNELAADWIFTGIEVLGNGGTMQVFDPTGFSTAKVYRVIVP